MPHLLECLPAYILHDELFKRLSINDLARLTRTCRYLKKVIEGDILIQPRLKWARSWLSDVQRVVHYNQVLHMLGFVAYRWHNKAVVVMRSSVWIRAIGWTLGGEVFSRDACVIRGRRKFLFASDDRRTIAMFRNGELHFCYKPADDIFANTTLQLSWDDIKAYEID